MSKRPWKPTVIKKLEGNPGKRPLPEDEPQFRPVCPKPPSDIDKEAKKFWKTYAPLAFNVGTLTEVDVPAFTIFAQIHGRLVNIRRFINKYNKSMVHEDRTIDIAGQEHIKLQQSVYVMMEKQYNKDYLAYAKAFGFIPVGRSGLKVRGGKEDEKDIDI